MKFTGHERDFNSPGGTGDDLDYMHARFYNPLLGRFLSTDLVLGRLGQPQSWNRYAYVRNNPLLLVDPDGRSEIGGVVTLLLLGLEHGPLPKATLGITEKTLTLAGFVGTGADTLADAQDLYHDGGSPLGIAGKALSEIDNSFDIIGGSFALTSTWKGASVLAKIGRGVNIAAAVIPTIIEIAHGTDPFTAMASNFPNIEAFFALIEPYTDAVTVVETRGPKGEFVDRGVALYHGDTPKPYLQYQWSQDVKGQFFRRSGARFNVVTYSTYHPPR
jgi:RHS repeat-associated protein